MTQKEAPRAVGGRSGASKSAIGQELPQTPSDNIRSAPSSQRTPPAAHKGENASELEDEVLAAIEHGRIAIGAPMWKMDDLAGLQDGYYSKIINPNAPNGRRARSATLQLVIDALKRRGLHVVVRLEVSGAVSTLTGLDKPSQKARGILHWRDKRFFSKIGRLGGTTTAKRHSKLKVSWGRKGAKVRRAKRERERTAGKNAPGGDVA
jgi:hypothetical protein